MKSVSLVSKLEEVFGELFMHFVFITLFLATDFQTHRNKKKVRKKVKVTI